MIQTTIKDGRGSGNGAKVGSEGELNVVVLPSPPADLDKSPLPFRQYFTDDGTSAGSNNMVVTSETEFYIKAIPEYDIYIGSCSILVADAGATLNKFGALTALSNGVKFEWITQDIGTTTIHEGITTNLEFMRLAGGNPAVGTGSDAFKADLSGSGADAYLPYVDFSDIFGLPWGLRLRKGTTDKLVWTVRDNLTGITTFDVIAYGIRV